LVAAQSIVLLDETWNPTVTAQAVARIFRYGQERPTRVYRLQYGGTVEANVYLRNVDKAALFRRVVDMEHLQVRPPNASQRGVRLLHGAERHACGRAERHAYPCNARFQPPPGSGPGLRGGGRLPACILTTF
jgi:hypothetical protein